MLVVPPESRVILNPPPPTVTPPSPTPPSSPAPARRSLADWLPGRGRRTRWWLWALLLLPVAPTVGVISYYSLRAATFDLNKIGEMPQRAVAYDVDGNFLSNLHMGENRITVPIDKVSPNFLHALVAREDTRFYEHHGVDPHGIARAILRNLTRHRAAEGASTLTQQLARNSLPLGGKTLDRKLLEAFVALRIEHHYTKQQILEFYVNRIFYGGSIYGIETASQAYFGKPSSQLDLSEAAMMAGLIRSPNRFSPLVNPTGAAHERDTVLARMAELHMITTGEEQAAEHEQIKVAKNRPSGVQDNYAMDSVLNELSGLLTDEQTDEGGLKIYTTIDPQLQAAATQAVEQQLAKIETRPGYEHPRKGAREGADESTGTDYLQGALVVIDNKEGAVRAIVGGREYKNKGFNRATDQPGRPVGSTFKPFMYTAAWQKGLLPGANIDDGPIRPGDLPDAPNWHPGNSDGVFGPVQPAEIGLIRSRNTMSVRVGELVGLDAVRQVGAQVGLANELPDEPTIFLGTFNTTLEKLTEAYTLFPNNGVRRKAYFIERIDDADGATIYHAQHRDETVLPAGVTWMTHTILEKVMQRGTAAESRALGFTRPGAGKTGTTNDFRDAWFVGYTSSLTCGVWVGLDHDEPIMSKGYGAALALPIWVQVMNKAPAQRYPAKEFQPPEPLRHVRVCRLSNRLATAGCQDAGTAYDIDLPVSRVPRVACAAHGGNALTPGQDVPLAPGQTPPPDGSEDPSQQPKEAFPKRFLRSFRKLFGG